MIPTPPIRPTGRRSSSSVKRADGPAIRYRKQLTRSREGVRTQPSPRLPSIVILRLDRRIGFRSRAVDQTLPDLARDPQVHAPFRATESRLATILRSSRRMTGGG